MNYCLIVNIDYYIIRIFISSKKNYISSSCFLSTCHLPKLLEHGTSITVLTIHCTYFS